MNLHAVDLALVLVDVMNIADEANDLMRDASGQIQLLEDESLVVGSASPSHLLVEARRPDEHDESTVAR